MKLENGHKKLFGSSFKIMLHCVILRNRLKYYKERWFKNVNTIHWKRMCVVDLFSLEIIFTK